MKKKPNTQPWFVSAFERAYLRVYAHRNRADAQLAIECAQHEIELYGSILDLCCGAGRHLEIMAERGIAATGLDLSEDLLAHTRMRLHKTPLVRADARELPFADESFDGVLNLFSSFGYFEDERDHLRMLEGMARVLKPDGRLMFDHMNPAIIKAGLVPKSKEERDGLLIESKRWIDEANKRVEKTVKITEEDEIFAEYTESVRFFSPSEFDALFKAAGLRIIKRLGDFAGSSFDDHSPRQVIIAERA